VLSQAAVVVERGVEGGVMVLHALIFGRPPSLLERQMPRFPASPRATIGATSPPLPVRPVQAMPMFPVLLIPDDAAPRERGRLYGAGAQRQARHSRDSYARLFASCGIAWAEACARALQLQPAIAQADPDLLDELAGIAEGSGLRLDEVLALNCRTEILPPTFLGEASPAADAALAANRAAGLPDWLDDAALDPAIQDGECTAMAVGAGASANGHTWLAQNWDWLGRQRQALVLLQGHDGRGTRFTTLTEGGMLAKIGVNQHGFALGLNILRSLQDGTRPGVPVHVLLRRLLSCRSLAEARGVLGALAAGPGFGAASNIPCADAQGEVACFELAPAGWAELAPQDGIVVHSNHFVCGALLPLQAPMSPALSSASRLDTARRHAGAGAPDLASLQRFLRDESDGHLSVCRRPDPALPTEARVESVAGIVIDCDERAMWVAPDVPSRCEFARVA